MIIGITGGIGSGKSIICCELAKQGFAVYDCDREAKRLITENSEVHKAVIELLGTEAFIPSSEHPFTGVYNTAYVAKQVFDNPELLAQLNAIVHPAVIQDIARYPIEKDQVLFVESAILFDAGIDRICDKVIIVQAPEALRIARTIERDYKGETTAEHIDKVRARIRAQKQICINYSDTTLIIPNDGKNSIPKLVSIITHWL